MAQNDAFFYSAGKPVRGQIDPRLWAVELPPDRSDEPEYLPVDPSVDLEAFRAASFLPFSGDYGQILAESKSRGLTDVWPVFLPFEGDPLVLRDDLIFGPVETQAAQVLLAEYEVGAKCTCEHLPWCRWVVPLEVGDSAARALRALWIANRIAQTGEFLFSQPNFVTISGRPTEPESVDTGADHVGIDHVRILRLEPARKLIKDQPDYEVSIMVIDNSFVLETSAFASRIRDNEEEDGGIPGQDDDSNCYDDDIRGWDFDTKSADLGIPLASEKDFGHGDQMATLAVGRDPPPDPQAAGRPSGVCQRCGLKLAAQPGQAVPDAFARAYFYASQRAAEVVSSSAPNVFSSNNLDLINYVLKLLVVKRQDVLFLASAGRLERSPAVHPATVAVGPSNFMDERCCDKPVGDHLDFLSPAREWPPYARASGATATAAGVGGLLLTLHPDLTPAQARDILRFTAEKIQANHIENSGYEPDLVFGRSDTHGHGRINACRALSTVAKMRIDPENDGFNIVAKASSPFGLKKIRLLLNGTEVESEPCLAKEVICPATWKCPIPPGTVVEVDAEVRDGPLGQASDGYRKWAGTASAAEDFCKIELGETKRERKRTL